MDTMEGVARAIAAEAALDEVTVIKALAAIKFGKTTQASADAFKRVPEHLREEVKRAMKQWAEHEIAYAKL